MEAKTEEIDHKSLVTVVVERLEAAIIGGSLRPGERIVEQKLCEQLGVSRSPLREAFRILENRGFLVNQARKGVSVAEVTMKEAVDIYTIRANLESLATYLAVKRQGAALASSLAELHKRTVPVVEKGDANAYFRLNTEFHETLINACGNERLIEMLNLFAKHTARYRMELLSLPGKAGESLKKHELLIESIRIGDAEGAEKLRKSAILANMSLIEQRFRDKRGEDED